MVKIDSQMARNAIVNFRQDLAQLTSTDGNIHKSKACLICDRLLEWNNMGIIPILWLHVIGGEHHRVDDLA
jgi:hypothetical protein